MTITELIEEAERLDKAATKGPWITGSIPWKVWANGGADAVCDVHAVGDAVPVAPGLCTSESMAANRDMIAHSRTLLPLLVTAIKNQQRQINAALTALREVKDDRFFAAQGLARVAAIAAELEDVKP